MDRRQFLQSATAAAAGVPLVARAAESEAPPHLRGYEELHARDPRQAARQWFADAQFGLFMHYGLYSQMGQGEWVMFRKPVPYEEYIKLAETFDPKNFDAEFITDLALEAGMKYVNLTSKHHDGFCLFDTKQTDYNSVRTAGRDLIGELTDACHRKGLGVFYYYSMSADWHHPWFLSKDYGRQARPPYDEPPEAYKLEKIEQFQRYIEYAQAQVRELVTQYGPVAGIWFDPYMGYFAAPEHFRIRQTYRMIRKHQPHALISYKQGVTGLEDFAAPERSGHSLADRVRKRHGKEAAKLAARAWRKNKDKHNEICDTLQPHFWGYNEAQDGKHRGPDEVMKMLTAARKQKANLLLNTGPLPDGSIYGPDVQTLREVGKRRA